MNQLVIRYVVLLMLTFDLYSIDLFLHHLNRKTKKINLSTKWNLKESGVFNPRVPAIDAQGNPIAPELIDYSEVSPMLKIVSSDVELSGENHSVTSNDIYHGGLVGIEIGYSPAELQADPTLQQPSGIQIKDLRLYEFDCALIIHHGVKNIKIENCIFSGCSIGVLVLGKPGDVLINSVLDVQLKDITAVGHAQDRHLSLEKIKSRVEGVYNYPVDHFMPLQKDTLNNDTVDVYTYAGIWVICAESVTFKNLTVHHIGYCDYPSESEGDGFRTYGIGVCLDTCRRVSMQNISCNDCFSELKAVGMQIDNILRFRLKDAVFSHHSSACTAIGIEVTNNQQLDYSVDEVIFDHVSCESIVGNIVIGLSLTGIRGLFGNDLMVKFNKGIQESYGLYSQKGHTISLENSTFSSMISTKTTNDVETTHGIIAAGIYGKNIQGCLIDSCNCVTMEALNSAIGLYLEDSSDIRVQNSQFSANTALTSRFNEEAQIRSEQDLAEISRYGPVVPATCTGGYGIFANNCQRMKIASSLAVSNKGHRAAGICCKTCKSIFILDTTAAAQIATGLMLDTSFLVDHVLDPTNSAIQAAHKSLLFSDLTKSSVDLVTTTDLFLERMTAIRARQATGLDPLYDDVIAMLASQNLLQAAIARYRVWGTAFGIHAHNSVGCIFKKNFCLGQVSLFDNAAGICFSGRNSGHLIEDCNLSYNVAWYLSAQAIPTSSAPAYFYKYDLSGMKVFWEALTNPWTVHRSLSNTYAIQSIAFSPDGTLLASGDSNNEVKIWDVTTWTLSQTLTGHTAPITSLAWNSDGTKLASSSSSSTDNIKVWNTSTWTVDETLTHGSTGVNALAWRGDDAYLVSGSSDTSNNIKIWNCLSWLVDETLTHGSTGVRALAWKGDGSRLASGSLDTSNNIKIWKKVVVWLEDETLSSHTDAVNSITWSPDDSLLASASSDNSVKIWDTSTYSVSQTLTDHTDIVNTVKFKENGKKLVSGSSDNTIKVWDTTAWGDAEKSIVVHTDVVNALDWKSDGIKIASGSTDSTIKVCYADTWKVAQDDNAVGIYNPTPYFIMQGQKLFGDGTLGDDISIRLKGTNDRVFVSPIGPISAGLILGDFMIDAYIKNNKMQFNVGNAGYAYGALFNVSYYSVLEQNLIEGSLASIYGFGSGLLEVTPHSVNTYIRNVLESNKVSTFSNANYMVPYNPADTHTLAFPMTKMFNGNFTQPTTDLDNIVIEYSQSSQSYTVESLVNMPLHPDLKNQLTDNNCWK